MSAIRDGIRGASRAPSRPTGRFGGGTGGPGGVGRAPRLGLLDLVLVLIAALAMVSRTPVGGLLWYGAEVVRGKGSQVPALTAYFSSSGAAAPPLVFTALPPDATAVNPDQLPEPWRTAARTTLAQQVPSGIASVLAVRGVEPTAEAALSEIDALWKIHRDPSLVLEVAALGADQRDRAVARAASAGEPDPDSYDGHRRYLSGAAALEADRFVGGTLALATALDLTWPLAVSHQVTSPFGPRIHPVLGQEKFHEGVDLGVPIGTSVIAAQKGKVAVVGESAVSGKYVIIDHGYGVHTAYCHLSATPVNQGDDIERAETFALSGNTGRSTGPHLHYGIKIAGRWVDPERFRR